VALGLLPVADALANRAASLSRTWKGALIAVLAILIGYQSWAARAALVAEDFSQAPALWATIGKAIPPASHVIAVTQDYGFDLMYWGWRKVDLWPVGSDLASVRNAERDLAARFPALTSGEDYFLVTSSGQLTRQPELKQILDGYSIAAQGNGYVLYDLHTLK
jgi:hypothetical protein